MLAKQTNFMTLLHEQEVNWGGEVAGTIKEQAGGDEGTIFIISKFSNRFCDSLQYHHFIFKIQLH